MGIVNGLYEVGSNYKAFLDALEAGEIPDEAVEDTLGAIDGEFEEKIDSIACIVKQLDADATAIKAEKDKLSERQALKEHQRDRMKDYIRQAMALVGKNKIETPRNKVSIGKPAKSVVITDLHILKNCQEAWKPYDYGKPTNVDKAKLKEILQAGKLVGGAELRDGAPRLTIK